LTNIRFILAFSSLLILLTGPAYA